MTDSELAEAAGVAADIAQWTRGRTLRESAGDPGYFSEQVNFYSGDGQDECGPILATSSEERADFLQRIPIVMQALLGEIQRLREERRTERPAAPAVPLCGSDVTKQAREIAAAATPGPWRSLWGQDDSDYEDDPLAVPTIVSEAPTVDRQSRMVVGIHRTDAGDFAGCARENANFIASSRELLPRLADAVDLAVKLVDSVRGALDGVSFDGSSATLDAALRQIASAVATYEYEAGIVSRRKGPGIKITRSQFRQDTTHWIRIADGVEHVLVVSDEDGSTLFSIHS